MKQYLIWGGVVAALIVAVGFGCFKWGETTAQRDIANSPKDTVIVVKYAPVTLPPITINPNPVHAKPDTIENRAKIDSLIATVRDRDTYIRCLLWTRTSEQIWDAAKDSAQIVGRLTIVYYPLTYEFKTQIKVDSLTVPERVLEIVRTVTINKTPIEPWIITAVSVILLILNMITK